MDTIDTIFIVSKVEIDVAFDFVDSILRSNHFQIETDGETFWLEEFDNFDSPNSGPYEIESELDANNFISKLKMHKVGGTISYSNDISSVLVAFASFNDSYIDTIKFYIQTNLYELHKAFFLQVFKELKFSINTIAIIQGNDLNDNWDEDLLIEEILRGTSNKKFEMTIS